MSRISRRAAFGTLIKASIVMAAGTLSSKTKAAGRHSDPDYCNPICFLRGTRIDLRRGSTTIESVRIGDEVRTHRGGWSRVKWIGRMPLAKRPGQSWPVSQQPVLIRRNALCEHVPSRDLRVSQQHAILVDDVLIPAKYLVNGKTILIEAPPVSRVEFYQIECEDHEVLFAHNVPAETFFATELRPQFANSDEYTELYGDERDRVLTPYRPIIRYSSLRAKAGALCASLLALTGIAVGPVQRARLRLKHRACLLEEMGASLTVHGQAR